MFITQNNDFISNSKKLGWFILIILFVNWHIYYSLFVLMNMLRMLDSDILNIEELQNYSKYVYSFIVKHELLDIKTINRGENNGEKMVR